MEKKTSQIKKTTASKINEAISMTISISKKVSNKNVVNCCNKWNWWKIDLQIFVIIWVNKIEWEEREENIFYERFVYPKNFLFYIKSNKKRFQKSLF